MKIDPDDITLEKLKDTHFITSILLDAVFDGVYIVDPQRNIVFWNKAAEMITGYRAEDVVGHRCQDNILNHLDENGHLLCATGCPLLKSMTTGDPGKMKVYPLHKSGRRVPVFTHVSPIRNRAGEIIGGIEVFRDISEEEKFRLLQEKFNDLVKKYISTATLEEIKSQLTAEGPPTTHLKDFTILYLDIAGFTAFSERRPPGEVVSMLNEIFGICEVISKEFHGDIDKFIGDAVMAVFIDANDAVAAADAILKALKVNNQLRKKDGKETIHVRIGMNSGKVIQGDIGTPDRKDRTVIGDAVNLASRIQAIAELDTIFIAESTFSRLRDAERFIYKQEVSVKGRVEPVKVFSFLP